MALEFLLAASQGSLIGLNFMEPPANFGQFLSGHAAVLVKFHGVVRHDRLPFHACVRPAARTVRNPTGPKMVISPSQVTATPVQEELFDLADRFDRMRPGRRGSGET
ncbi:MAG TPA: hypothetical protein VHS33_09520 [Sphingomicrobium sp.]|nr:hypothetical protein [Sphingomicrobium sp.]